MFGLRGMNLWPTTRSFVFVELFHRGLLLVGVGAGRRAGVGVIDERGPFDGDGDAMRALGEERRFEDVLRG